MKEPNNDLHFVRRTARVRSQRERQVHRFRIVVAEPRTGLIGILAGTHDAAQRSMILNGVPRRERKREGLQSGVAAFARVIGILSCGLGQDEISAPTRVLMGSLSASRILPLSPDEKASSTEPVEGNRLRR